MILSKKKNHIKKDFIRRKGKMWRIDLTSGTVQNGDYNIKAR